VLVLTRRKNQSIIIGDDIVVTVLEVKGDQIRLGITAPRHVQVYREELLAALKDANTSAVLGDGAAPMAPPAPPPAATGDDTPSARTGLRAGLGAVTRRRAA
jgi:carbon storage regulator